MPPRGRGASRKQKRSSSKGRSKKKGDDKVPGSKGRTAERKARVHKVPKEDKQLSEMDLQRAWQMVATLADLATFIPQSMQGPDIKDFSQMIEIGSKISTKYDEDLDWPYQNSLLKGGKVDMAWFKVKFPQHSKVVEGVLKKLRGLVTLPRWSPLPDHPLTALGLFELFWLVDPDFEQLETAWIDAMGVNLATTKVNDGTKWLIILERAHSLLVLQQQRYQAEHNLERLQKLDRVLNFLRNLDSKVRSAYGIYVSSISAGEEELQIQAKRQQRHQSENRVRQAQGRPPRRLAAMVAEARLEHESMR